MAWKFFPALAATTALIAHMEATSFELKGLAIGKPARELVLWQPHMKCHFNKSGQRAGCFATGTKGDAHHVRELSSLANMPVELWMFSFEDQRTNNMRVWMRSSDHAGVIKALKEKFGDPTGSEVIAMQDKGKKANATITRWDKGNESLVVINPRRGSPSGLEVWLSTKEHANWMLMHLQEAKPAGAKDL